MASKEKPPVQLYMLIDVTTQPGGVKILSIAPIHAIQFLGELAKAEGKSVIGPPLEGRGFSSLPTESLQYLLWNTFSISPDGMDYGKLVANCLYHALLMEVDTTDLRDLEAACARLTGDSEQTTTKAPKAKKEKVAKEPKEKKEKVERDPSGRPPSTSTTGLVWDHADTCLEEATKKAGKKGEIDLKELSRAVRVLCEKDGLNPGTVSVQFGKWKKSKFSA